MLFLLTDDWPSRPRRATGPAVAKGVTRQLDLRDYRRDYKTDNHHTEPVELVDKITAQRREAAVHLLCGFKDASRVGEDVGARVGQGDVCV